VSYKNIRFDFLITTSAKKTDFKKNIVSMADSRGNSLCIFDGDSHLT